MATIKITALTALSTPSSSDVMPIVDVTATTTKKITWTNILAAVKSYTDTLYTLTNLGGVPTSRTVNGYALSSNVTITKTDLSLSNVDNTSDATKNSATATLTNKRITKREGTTSSTSSLTINSDQYDIYTVTGLGEAITINEPTGTPTQGQPLLIRIKDNGTARAITWNAAFKVIGVSLPTTTVINKLNYIFCVYNSTSLQWDVLGSNQEV